MVSAYKNRLIGISHTTKISNWRFLKNGWTSLKLVTRLRRVSSNDALIADNATIKKKIPRIHRIMMTFRVDDASNVENFGLCYRQPQSWTFQEKSCAGYTLDKSRITFLAACNSSSTEKLPIMIEKRAWKPQQFKTKTGQELGFDYYGNI